MGIGMMRNFNILTARLRTLGVVCVLCIPWTVLAQNSLPKLNLRRSHSPEEVAEIEAGKAAALETVSAEKAVDPETSRTLADFKSRLLKLNTEALAALSSQADALSALNPEAFNDLVDKLPELSADEKKDQALRQELKTSFELNFEKMSPDPREALARMARESLAEKVAKEERKRDKDRQKKELQDAADQMFAELVKEQELKAAETKKKLDEALAKNGSLDESNKKSAENEKKSDGLDPALLAALLEAKNNSDSDAAPPAGGEAGGSPSGGGGGGSSGKSRSSDDSDRPTPSDPTEKKFSDISNAFESAKTPEEAKPVEKKSSDTAAYKPRKRDEEPETPVAKTPELPSYPSESGSPDPVPQSASLGSKSPLPALSSGASAGASSASSSGGASSGVGPVQASLAGGVPASSGGGDFPFGGSPAASGGNGVPQKFDYVRANNYLNSSTGEGGTANGDGDENPDSSGPVATMNTGSIGSSSRAPAQRPMAINQPAFVQAVSRALGNLCASGSLSCESKGEVGKR